MIFRNDDVCSSTDFKDLNSQYEFLHDMFPGCRILSGVSVFCKNNSLGSVYEDVPFKNKHIEYFYDVDSVMQFKETILGEIASHGLVHVDHSKMSRDAQEMSILTSCRFLDVDTFIPPFNKYNDDTLNICIKNKIRLIRPVQGWKSLEFEPFNPDHELWYWHSWRYDVEKFKEVLNGKHSLNVG